MLVFTVLTPFPKLLALGTFTIVHMYLFTFQEAYAILRTQCGVNFPICLSEADTRQQECWRDVGPRELDPPLSISLLGPGCSATRFGPRVFESSRRLNRIPWEPQRTPRTSTLRSRSQTYAVFSQKAGATFSSRVHPVRASRLLDGEISATHETN